MREREGVAKRTPLRLLACFSYREGYAPSYSAMTFDKTATTADGKGMLFTIQQKRRDGSSFDEKMSYHVAFQHT
jgi:hypothetical protein